MTVVDVLEVDRQFERILRQRDLRIAFQPVVHLPSGAVAGYEALVRGPEGSALTSAASLLAAAHRAGRLAEFDWAARACACRAALEAGLNSDQLFFLNIEPIALDSECPPDLWPDIERGFQVLRVVLEVTERSLDRDPGTLLDGVERYRPTVAGIALDDVGSQPATLAMMPLVAPTIIKIDRHLVQAAPGAEVAHLLDAVHEQAERTGATVLAEGVQTEHDREQAHAFGALLAQGYLLGGAGPLAMHTRRPTEVIPLHHLAPATVGSPFEVLPGPAIKPAGDDLIVALTRHVATCATASAPTLRISLLPRADLLDSAELGRLARLADQGVFSAVLGHGIPSEPGRGIRGTGLRHEPLPHGEWATIAVGPCFSAAVLARQISGRDGAWQYGIVHDRTRAISAARALVRLLGAPEPRFRFDA